MCFVFIQIISPEWSLGKCYKKNNFIDNAHEKNYALLIG